MKTDYKKVCFITLFLDSIILIITYFRNLSYYDLLFVTNIILCHVTFLIGLSLNDTDLIDPCHYALFITLLLSIFIVSDILILCLCLFFILLIQILWVVEERCILNEPGDKFGYSKSLSIVVLLNTVALSYRIGNKI